MATEPLLVVEDAEDILDLLLMDAPGSAIDPIGTAKQLFTNPPDKPTERSITGRFG